MTKPLEAMTLHELLGFLAYSSQQCLLKDENDPHRYSLDADAAQSELLRRFAGRNDRFEVHVVSGVSGVFATVVEHSASTVFTVEGATEDEAEAAAKAWITEHGG